MRGRRRRRRRSAALILVAILLGLVLVPVTWIGSAALIYSPEYVRRVLVWRESDVGDYLHHFPQRALMASPEPFHFAPAPRDDPAPGQVAELVESAFAVDDLDSFLTRTDTQSLLVIQHDRVLYERYANGWQRDSLVTSFSVAKSFVSTLVGMAIEEGYIGGLDDPITDYLPELAERDARFARITIRHLLAMASGLDYQEMRWFLFNGDDPLTTYHPDQRAISLSNIQIVEPPGQHFRYNKYHPQLLGLILERATGMSVTAWTQTRLWDRLGMEFDGAWTLDSTESGFEKMEAGLNARPIDFAKLGRLFLEGGRWNGEQLISAEWVDLATGGRPTRRAPTFDGRTFYGLMWWGLQHPDGTRDFYAAGDHGQYIYVSPANRVIIVRTGDSYGVPGSQWVDAFARVAAALGRAASSRQSP